MAIVTVQNKYQVVEAKVERGRITFTPKTPLEPGIAQSLADFKQGQVHGPFQTAADLGKSLARESKRLPATECSLHEITPHPK